MIQIYHLRKKNLFRRPLSLFFRIKETIVQIYLVEGNESLQNDKKMAGEIDTFFRDRY